MGHAPIHLHEAFVAACPKRAAQAAALEPKVDHPKPAAAVIGELKLALAREQQKNADLLDELRIAVGECCNAYWTDGHAERVWRLYGIGSPA